MSNNLKNAIDLPLVDLVAITDAEFEGDPDGTDANAAYFQGNIHNYIKDLAKAVTASNVYWVSDRYTDMEDYHFETIVLAYAQLLTDGSTTSNKKVIAVHPKGSSYAGDLTLTHSNVAYFIGTVPGATIISGNVTISAGTHIFYRLKFTGNISVTGGKAIFIDCDMDTGLLTQSGGSASTVLIRNAGTWGAVVISGNNKTFWMENVGNVLANSGTSIELSSGMTGGQYVIRNSYLAGDLVEDTVATEFSNSEQNALTRPTY